MDSAFLIWDFYGSNHTKKILKIFVALIWSNGIIDEHCLVQVIFEN